MIKMLVTILNEQMIPPLEDLDCVWTVKLVHTNLYQTYI